MEVMDEAKPKDIVVVPKGQEKLTEEELNREVDIEYTEPEYAAPDEREDTVLRYYNVRKQKICKERHTFQLILDLTPSVVFEHKDFPTDSDFELPVTYKKVKQRLPTLGAEMTQDAKEEEDEEEEKNYGDEDDNDVVEEEEETGVIDSSSDSAVAPDVISVESISGEEEAMDEIDEKQEDIISLAAEPWENEPYNMLEENEEDNDADERDGSKDVGSNVLEEDYIEEQENEDMVSLPSWPSKKGLDQEKSMFNMCNDATQMNIQPMKTYCAIQTDVPKILQLGGRFCMATTYDAYRAFETKVKNAEEKMKTYMLKYEKLLEEKEEKENMQDVGDLNLDVTDLKIGDHKVKEEREKKEEEVRSDKEEDPDADDDYLVNDHDTSDDDDMNVDSGEGDVVSSSEEESEGEAEVEEEQPESDAEEAKDTQVDVPEVEDIDGYDLLPEDFDFEGEDAEKVKEINWNPVKIIEEKIKPKEQNGEKMIVRLTTAQKEQILNHILNPLEYDAVVLVKDEERDVNFDGPDSDDDEADDGEYLLAVYGTHARKMTESDTIVEETTTQPMAAESEAVKEEEDEYQDMDDEPAGDTAVKYPTAEELEANKANENLRRLLEKHRFITSVKKSGGVIIEKKYKRMRGITKAMKKRITRLLLDKKKVQGAATKLKQIRLMRKLELKRTIKDKVKFVSKKDKKKKANLQGKKSKEVLPKQRRVTVVKDPYRKEGRLYNHYTEEMSRLTLVGRLIHQKQNVNVGMDFINFEDYDDKDRSLFPLKKMPFLGAGLFRVTHMSWTYHLKHNLAISYESEHSAAYSHWHEGYVVLYHPMANAGDYDKVYKFKSGVRYFDIAFEWINNGLMLVALEDGSIHLVKLPFPNVLKSTTAETKHSSPVVQVMWMPDWHGKEKVDAKGKPLPNVRVQRFLSYAEDGLLKFWWVRRYVGFTVYRTVHLHQQAISTDMDIRYVSITCVGSDYHDRTLLYIGTRDGKIYKYNTMYPPQTFDCVLDAHVGPVIDIAINYYNRDVFLSGGQDGLVKLWRGNGPTPVWAYWVENPVSSIKWSHYTSYVWAVVTLDNTIQMYNLERHFHKPMTNQSVLEYSSCVKMEFHHKLHLLLIADNYCNVFVFKVPRTTIEPEEIEKELSWDTKKVKEEEKDSFTLQRERLKKALDRNEILMKACTRVNRGGIFEKQIKEALENKGGNVEE